MDIIKKTIKLGNSAGVLLPKSLLGSEVKISVVNKPVNIKKDALKLLEPYFDELRGAYILNEEPVEVLAISSRLKKIISEDNARISIVPLVLVKRDIKTNLNLRDKIIKAGTILNRALLADLKKEIRS
ncbi:MAG: hypothetical protein AABX71_02165 [Nanoarchaeota archaeon]